MGTDGEMRVGIVGFGGIAEHHAKSIQRIPWARLVAAADIVQERLDVAKEKYGADGYLDYHDLLAREDVDVVSVCTPSGLHGPVAIEAAKAKKHCITEKPIDVTLPVADEMIRTARENGVKLSVIFQNRFNPSARQVKKIVDEGRLGNIFLADAYIKWHRTQEYYDAGTKWRGTLALDGGGAVINQSVHYIDFLQWVIGPVTSVTAKKRTVAHDIEGEDVAVGIFTFENGAMGVFEGSTACYPGFPTRVEIHGTKGSLVWSGRKIESLHIVGEEPESEAGENEGGTEADPMAFSEDLHLVQLRRFFEAIREDREPDVSGEEGRKALEIVVALYRSAETGQPVSLPLTE